MTRKRKRFGDNPDDWKLSSLKQASEEEVQEFLCRVGGPGRYQFNLRSPKWRLEKIEKTQDPDRQDDES